MGRKLVISEFGTIYDAVMSQENPEHITDDRIERTTECLIAVANHMKHMADGNFDNDYWKYTFEHLGALVWINKDCLSLMGKIWRKIEEYSFERYGADCGMGGELIIKLDDLYEVFYDIMNNLVGFKEDEQEVQ